MTLVLGLVLAATLVLGVPAAGSVEGTAGWVIISLVWVTVGPLAARVVSEPEHRAALPRLFILGLALRLFTAIAGNYWVPPWWFAEDDGPYDQMAWTLASTWLGEPEHLMSVRGEPGYPHLLACVYVVFGRSYLAGLALNAGAGALMSILAYRVGLLASGSASVAMRSAWYMALLPSTIIWSGMLVRDAWTGLLILGIIHSLLRLEERAYGHLGAFALCLLGLYFFRSYLLTAVGLGCALLLLLPIGGWDARRMALGAVLCLAVALGRGYLGGTVESDQELSLERLETVRRSLATGGSAYFGEVDLSNPWQAVAFFPVGVAYFLLGPFPWMIRSLKYAMTLPDLLLLYASLGPFLRGAIHGWRVRPRSLGCVLIPMFTILAAYSLVSANLGTAYRHRSQILGPFFICAALGLEIRREKVRRPAAGKLTLESPGP